MSVWLFILACFTVAGAIEWWSYRHRPGRHIASRGPYAVLTVEFHPDGDIVTGPPEELRELLLERCREADAASRGGAR